MAGKTNNNTLSDLELAELIKLGNHQAFTEIFDRYSPLLFVHAFNKLNDREKARDAVQEVFIKIWSKKESLNISTNLSGYLYISLKNIILDAIAREKIKTEILEDLQNFLSDPGASADYAVRERLLNELIKKEIASLPPRMRQVFELSRTHQLSHKEIAERLNISEETVRDQVKKAIKILRRRIRFFVFLSNFF